MNRNNTQNPAKTAKQRHRETQHASSWHKHHGEGTFHEALSWKRPQWTSSSVSCHVLHPGVGRKRGWTTENPHSDQLSSWHSQISVLIKRQCENESKSLGVCDAQGKKNWGLFLGSAGSGLAVDAVKHILHSPLQVHSGSWQRPGWQCEWRGSNDNLVRKKVKEKKTLKLLWIFSIGGSA